MHVWTRANWSKVSGMILSGLLGVLLLSAPVHAGCTEEVRDTVLVPSEPAQGTGPCAGLLCTGIATDLGTEVAIDPDWVGASFWLRGAELAQCVGCYPTNPLATPADFAVTWMNGEGEALELHDTPAGEAGTIPVDTTHAVVTYRGTSLDHPFVLSIVCMQA